MLGLPFSVGAFFSGGLAASAMLFFNERTKLKEDTIIGLIFSSFFALGLFMKSLKPMSVSIDTIVLGNIPVVSPTDIVQIALIGIVSLVILCIRWKDMMVTFFDENHARSIGINTRRLKGLFFALLAASTVVTMQTVGAFLCYPGRNSLSRHRPFSTPDCHFSCHRYRHKCCWCLFKLPFSRANRGCCRVVASIVICALFYLCP